MVCYHYNYAIKLVKKHYLFMILAMFTQTEVHKLRSMSPMINQFQKEIQNLFLLKENKLINPVFGNNIA